MTATVGAEPSGATMAKHSSCSMKRSTISLGTRRLVLVVDHFEVDLAAVDAAGVVDVLEPGVGPLAHAEVAGDLAGHGLVRADQYLVVRNARCCPGAGLGQGKSRSGRAVHRLLHRRVSDDQIGPFAARRGQVLRKTSAANAPHGARAPQANAIREKSRQRLAAQRGPFTSLPTPPCWLWRPRQRVSSRSGPEAPGRTGCTRTSGRLPEAIRPVPRRSGPVL